MRLVSVHRARPLVPALLWIAFAMAPARGDDPAPPEPPPAPVEEPAPASLEEELAKELAEEPPPESKATAPITLVSGARGRNYLNLSLDGLIAAGASSEPDVESLQTGGHDPIQRGFSVQNGEIVLEGAVDPYFKGQTNVVFQIDDHGETSVELEEIFVVTTSLPANLQVKVGQYQTEFGRLNTQHPHSWDFVDQPLVMGRMFGGDGMRSVGARLSWLMPVPFFSELLVGVQNAFGETLPSFGGSEGDELFGRTLVQRDVRSAGDLLVVPRYSASFDPGQNQTVVLGASGAFGPNASGDATRTRILGVDLLWKWKSPRAQKGFPFVSVQVEGLQRRYEAAAAAALPAETLGDWGAYGQVVWGIKPRWLVGVRYDRVDGDGGLDALDPALERRWRASADATWFPTEYSKLRLQVNRDGRRLSGPANSVWLQLEFLLGAHAAHKF